MRLRLKTVSLEDQVGNRVDMGNKRSKVFHVASMRTSASQKVSFLMTKKFNGKALRNNGGGISTS